MFLHAGTSANGASTTAGEVMECWHLTPQEHEKLLSTCLLPLASLHASVTLAHNLTAETSSIPSETDKSPQAQSPGKEGHGLACIVLLFYKDAV